MLSIEIPDLTKLGDAVKILLDEINDKHIVAFYGKMGAGKTTIIKEICRQLNVTDIVNSPTFALVNEYHCTDGKSIFHFDFYRINKLDEAYDLGYEEYFYSNNLCLIEWAEKIEQLLPDDALIVKIEETDNGKRIVTIEK
ncbi:MAG: tRNA (adenosine(37)-N6)-threonylcarbamoyltransferase complex ATPase subunit type 1 TsaE [Prevotellaceae bacterium]|jgi:tRNA threonylcarbamoyladenosine biosynthesis protein TsaE|nr:tRNA (adenosine(37)-N6)-threonylcarbamoyltransferase complex ATPase subunit type 1 TsaE [Prevotellaceae bacterium]